MQHTSPPFDLDSGSVAADFTNTLDGSRVRPGTDRLARYADVVEFARQAGLVDTAQAKRLLAAAARHPQKATEVYRRAIALREAMWRTFDRVAQDREAAADDVAGLGAEAADAMAHARVARDGAGYGWRWPETEDLARPLWPIAHAAALLLMSDELRGRVRECASDTCDWLFLDRTRNASRRWCDMSGCGNRAKVRAFRERQKRSASGRQPIAKKRSQR